MNDGHGHIIATCAVCGFRFDVLFGLGCPACRKEAIKQAFKPIDPLRTALGIKLNTADALEAIAKSGVYWHGPVPEEAYMRGSKFTNEEEKQEAIPGMSDDPAEQVYRLCQLFRK